MYMNNTTRSTLNNTAGAKVSANQEITPHEAFTIAIGILGVVLNGLLLIAMVRNASKIFTSNGAYLVANVAVADLLTGLNSSLWGLQSTFPLPQALTVAMYSLFWTTIEASFLTIFVMSLERYIAIIFPFSAGAWLSKSRTVQSCVLVWVVSGLCGACIFAFRDEAVSFCLTIVFEITILVTTFLYYKIFVKLGQRRACLPSQLTHGARGNKELQREYKLTTVVVALTFILIVTVLPYMIGGQISLVHHMFKAADNPDLKIFLHYYMPVELMNFALNPIVYAWRLPKYRHALLRTLQFR